MNNQPLGTTRYNMGFLWKICFIAAMGGLLFGYDWMVIGGAKLFYEPFFDITDATPLWRGWAVSSALVGCMIGAIVSGIFSDRLGRKKLLIFAGFMFTLSAVGTALAWNFTSFIVFRLIGGVGIGLASNLSPMYIAEIAPAKFRGRFVSINQLTITVGVLLAPVINWQLAEIVPTAEQLRLLSSSDAQIVAYYEGTEQFDLAETKSLAQQCIDDEHYAKIQAQWPDLTLVKLADDATEQQKKELDKENKAIKQAYILPTWNGQSGWRWMFGMETIFAFAFFMLMFIVPESPRWLVKFGRDEEARLILSRVGGDAYADSEIADIRSTLASEEISQVRFRDLLESKLFKILMLGVFLAVLQQWCGINVVFTYAQEIFASAGYEVSGILFNIVIVGAVNMIFTFVAIFAVDKVGRRPLMLFGAIGLMVIYIALGIGYYTQSTGLYMLLLVVLAIACYSMTLAPITWVVISEVFPNRIRGAAVSVAVLSLWAGNAILSQVFPVMKDGLKNEDGTVLWAGLGAHGSFWVFAAICLVGAVVVYLKLPETKNKSLEEIERELVD